MRRTLLAAALVIGATAAPAQAPRPVIDVHIHYSHDTWSGLPPPEAIKVLRLAGLRKAFVSSSSDDGTQMLLKAAPDLIVPVLRPYRRRGETSLQTVHAQGRARSVANAGGVRRGRSSSARRQLVVRRVRD
jgi:hypothetical protein